MGRIPDQAVEEVRDRADIVQIVGRHVTLKRSGPRHWGLCPFHSEKTPSFQVHEERQIFHCFGCGVSGDVFAFMMHQDALEFPEAVRALAREVGVTLPASGGEPTGLVSALHRVNEVACQYFRETLRSPAGAPARRYLEGRGISQELIDRFQIGYVPASWDGLLKHLARSGQPLEMALKAGLVAQRQTGSGHYDRFRGRVLFPITEPGGHVLGFGGRALAEDVTPKYLNSAESPIYHKGRVFFGLPLAIDAIRRRGRAVIVEGYFDLLALHRAGIEEGVAPCGTALTVEQARRLRRYTQDVVLLFDGDEAGRQAAERSLPLLLAEGLRVRAAFLPAGEDPDTLIQRSGAAALEACLDAAEPLLDHLLRQRMRRRSGHAWDVADAAHAVAPLLRAIPDPVERATYQSFVARTLDVPLAVLEKLLRSGPARRPSAPTEAAEPGVTPVRIDPAMREVLGALASHPDLLPVVGGLKADWVPAGNETELLGRLSEAVRLHGENALARLLSPATEDLSDPLKSALSRIVAESEPLERPAAEQALRDCMAQLGIRALDRQSRSITTRLESCKDRTEQEALLTEQQLNLARRQELWNQVQHV